MVFDFKILFMTFMNIVFGKSFKYVSCFYSENYANHRLIINLYKRFGYLVYHWTKGGYLK